MRLGRQLSILTIFACCIACSDAELPPPPQLSPAASAYGIVPGHYDSNFVFVADPDYPPGVFAVALADSVLIAFDADSTRTGNCVRINNTAFELPNGNVKYHRFRCDPSFVGRTVVFVAQLGALPLRGEKLDWQQWHGDAPLPRPSTADPSLLHSYTKYASPEMLPAQLLVSSAWFTGVYPPRKEFDQLRGDSITFGHYELLDRAIFVGTRVTQLDHILYGSSDAADVSDALLWAFLPENASEKTTANISALYKTANGYLLRISRWRDHEGAGSGEWTLLYSFEREVWRLVAEAERIRMY